MFHRLTIIAIVAFWLVMTGLLVRLELAPEQSSVLDVPVALVWQNMFTHGEPSVLNITENKLPIGIFSLQPRAAAQQRSLHFSGNLWLRLPALTRQRILWEGVVELTPDLSVQSLRLGLTLRDPACRIGLFLNETAQTLRFDVTQGASVLASGTFPLNAAGLQAALPLTGLDPQTLAAFLPALAAPSAKSASSLAVTAKQTRFIFHGEKISAFQVTLHQGDTPLAEIYVSQLGQVLAANTAFGYSLLAQD